MFKNNFKKTVFLTAILALIFCSACSLKKEKELSLSEAQSKVEKFVNDNFMVEGKQVKISDMAKDDQTGLYKFSLDLGDSQTYESYISKDGREFFPQAYDIAELEQTLNNVDEETGASKSVEEVDPGIFNESADFSTDKKVAVYLFWGDGCPHCADQRVAMVNWVSTYPDIEIKTYETWKNSNNAAILEDLAQAYGTNVEGVPMTFIGNKYWVGYSAGMESEMINKIKQCLEQSCENPGDRLSK